MQDVAVISHRAGSTKINGLNGVTSLLGRSVTLLKAQIALNAIKHKNSPINIPKTLVFSNVRYYQRLARMGD